MPFEKPIASKRQSGHCMLFPNINTKLNNDLMETGSSNAPRKNPLLAVIVMKGAYMRIKMSYGSGM